MALDGTTKHGLFQACKAILRGALGHAFFPNPVEFRQQCDKAMEHHDRMRQRVAIRERIARETPPDLPPRTEEEKARVQQIMQDFQDSCRQQELVRFEAERAEIRARYGMTPERLASIKDQPLPAGMVQVGAAKIAAE